MASKYSMDRAKELLNHYIQLAMSEGGTLRPDSDTTAELNELVERIVDAAVYEITVRRTLAR